MIPVDVAEADRSAEHDRAPEHVLQLFSLTPGREELVRRQFIVNGKSSPLKSWVLRRKDSRTKARYSEKRIGELPTCAFPLPAFSNSHLSHVTNLFFTPCFLL